MIRIERTTVPCPAILRHGRESEAEASTAVHKRPRRRRSKRPGSKAYAHPEVRAALQLLFHCKCAYCESRYVAMTPEDVDHWRPKGRIRNAEGVVVSRTGYYWLVSEWSNLFPSCPKCNRRLNHEVIGSRARRTAGKFDHFPLADERNRARRPGDELKEEQPLLLNPCADKPDDELEFVLDDGEAGYDQLGLLRPKRNASNEESIKGSTSIEAFVLNRRPLVEDRRERALLILDRLRRLLKAVRTLDKQRDPVEESDWSSVLAEMIELKRFLHPNAPFRLLATQLIKPFIDALTAKQA